MIMNLLVYCLLLSAGLLLFPDRPPRRIFDVHLHGAADPAAQLRQLAAAGVYRAAVSTSQELQNRYRNGQGLQLLYGLMLPCPGGKVPYSGQACFSNGGDWPDTSWVDQQAKAGHIDFLGEVLGQYYGISPSDSSLFPYYAIAERYGLPVGIHTGGAGPDHGSSRFQYEMGNPALLKGMLDRFPRLKVWIMHAGDRFYPEAIAVMKAYPRVYTDISALCNPDIVPPAHFSTIVQSLLAAGLEDRILFGSDNGPIDKVVAAVESLEYLTQVQKEKIFYRNAEAFFTRR
ncbi:MAG TPA: amidohydrolase family protein [Chitinophagaceae bacterium]|jgi:hypothetical protein|nr:amidohydrolase family protein [Chitinophagaceae bacterium]